MKIPVRIFDYWQSIPNKKKDDNIHKSESLKQKDKPTCRVSELINHVKKGRTKIDRTTCLN